MNISSLEYLFGFRIWGSLGHLSLFSGLVKEEGLMQEGKELGDETEKKKILFGFKMIH